MTSRTGLLVWAPWSASQDGRSLLQNDQQQLEYSLKPLDYGSQESITVIMGIWTSPVKVGSHVVPAPILRWRGVGFLPSGGESP